MKNGLSVINLYNGIYTLLTSDSDLLEKLSIPIIEEIVEGETVLTPPTNAQKGRKIQKRSKPQELANNLPMIAFYTPGGNIDPINQEVFRPVFYFDIYTQNNVNLAHELAERVFMLLDDKVNEFSSVENGEAEVIDAHESDAGLPDTYCFTLEVLFSITI
jgi:hypothetical protein